MSEAPSEDPPRRRWLGVINPETFAPFRYRDFRVLWGTTVVRSAALWLEMVARPVLIVELTGEAFLLGVVLAAYLAPNLVLAPVMGVIIDRFPYRHVLIGSFAANIVSSGLLFVLLLFDQAAAWHVIALAAISGASTGFFNPTRRAVLPAFVEPAHLRAAMALSQTGQTSMRIGGALLAGLLLRFADFTWIFGVMVVLQVAASMLISTVHAGRDVKTEDHGERDSTLAQITAGARWAARTRWPLVVIAFTIVLFVFMQPYEAVMVPLIVIDELERHKSWVGYLVAIGGIGATLGSVVLASVDEIKSPNAVMLGIVCLGGIVLLVLSQAPSVWVIAGCTFFGSACVNNMTAIANLAIVAHAPERLRGQALALMNLAIGAIPVGALFAGALAGGIGPRFGLVTMGACLMAAALVAVAVPSIRWWLWRRRRYAQVSKEEWLSTADSER